MGPVGFPKAKLDDVEVFSGPVDLVEMSKDNESEQTAPTLFTFEVPINFIGSKKMSITVGGAPVRFGQIVTNWTEVELGAMVYGGSKDTYCDVVKENSEGIRDPRTNVTINGIACSADRALGKGTWHWLVEPGSVFEHTLTIDQPGSDE